MAESVPSDPNPQQRPSFHNSTTVLVAVAVIVGVVIGMIPALYYSWDNQERFGYDQPNPNIVFYAILAASALLTVLVTLGSRGIVRRFRH